MHLRSSVIRPSSLRTGLGLFFALLSILGCDGTAERTATNPADLVITHGRVYTFAWGEPAADGTPAADAPRNGDGWHPDAEAVAIRDGLIVFVGGAEDAEAHVGPETEILDVGGATVLPGLVDSHTHVAGLGELASRVNLIGVETEEEAVALVAERAASTPGAILDGIIVATIVAGKVVYRASDGS
ncbi:MAG: amidohydrolase family protein [bacterium]|nr:amidohydrolase family protein [bacterium]